MNDFIDIFMKVCLSLLFILIISLAFLYIYVKKLDIDFEPSSRRSEKTLT